jgi:hypothetical protein
MITRYVGVLCALALGGTVGCSSAADRPAGGPARPALGHPLGGVTQFTPADQDRLTQAENSLVRACMAGRGFEFRAARPRPAAAFTPGNAFGLVTPEEAAAHGYGITEHAARGAAQDPNDALLAELPEPRRAAWQAAFGGTAARERRVTLPDGTSFTYRADGCAYTARVRLYGPEWDRLYFTVQAYGNQVVTRAAADDGFRRAERDWAGCVRARGVPAAGLDEARRGIADKLAALTPATGPPDPARLRDLAAEEVRVAGIDARCADEAGLWRAAARAQQAAERAVLGDRRGAVLDRMRTLRAAARTRAASGWGAPGSASSGAGVPPS